MIQEQEINGQKVTVRLVNGYEITMANLPKGTLLPKDSKTPISVDTVIAPVVEPVVEPTTEVITGN